MNSNNRIKYKVSCVANTNALFSSVQFSRSVVSDSLRPHESQHARPPCPSPTPGVHPDSRFYVRGVVETVKKLRWEPTVVHCSGWISALAPIYLKRIYNEDPSFRSAKVAYALYDETFEGNLNERFFEKMKMDGFSEEDLEIINNKSVDFVTLNKLAIKYADGIIQASPTINEELVEYAKSLGKPFMEYPGEENYIEAYAQFYQSL